jgi:phosphate transport system substrate-binding protein
MGSVTSIPDTPAIMRTVPSASRRAPTPQHVSRRGFLTVLGAVTLLPGPGSRCFAATAQPGCLRIAGTGMALATMRHLGTAFAAATPGIAVDVLPSLGSSGGLAAAAAGVIDLALSARALTETERAKGLRDTAYARTPIAFVSHPSTSQRTISISEVAAILAGTLTVWPDGTPVRLVRREPSDADWAMLRGISPDTARAVDIALQRPGLLTVATDQQNADALERLPGSFGAMSLGQVRAEDRHLVAFALDGVEPNAATLASGRYPLSRTLRAAWREPPRPELSAFLNFLGGPPAADILTRLGHAPAPPGSAP